MRWSTLVRFFNKYRSRTVLDSIIARFFLNVSFTLPCKMALHDVPHRWDLHPKFAIYEEVKEDKMTTLLTADRQNFKVIRRCDAWQGRKVPEVPLTKYEAEPYAAGQKYCKSYSPTLLPHAALTVELSHCRVYTSLSIAARVPPR